MNLYFIRHGNADWPDWNGADDERPLTKKGGKQARRVAKLLCQLGVDPAVVLSSPLPRALQTAELVADGLGVHLRQEPALGKSFDLPALRAILKRLPAGDLIVVGHEPSFSRVIEQLTGARVELKKAGVARVDLENPKSNGTLLWLLPPKIVNS